MEDKPLISWKSIALFFEMETEAVRKFAARHPDIPLYRESRIFTTQKALTEWIYRKATEAGEQNKQLSAKPPPHTA